jgi:hypothetical protein
MTGKAGIIIAIIVAAAVIGIVLLTFSGEATLFSPAGTTGTSVVTPGITGDTTAAVQSFSGPAGKYVYIVTIIAPQGGHVITAEYLLNNQKGMNEWKFFQYENLDIKPGDWQMPYGNASRKTIVEIHKVTNLSVVGGSELVYDGEVFPAEFFIDDKGNVTEEGNIAPKDCYEGIPREIAGRLVMLKGFGQFGISDCSSDPGNKIFTLKIFHNNDPVAVSQFASLRTDGWTVKVISDTPLEQSIMSTHDRLHTLKEDPNMKIHDYDLIVDSRTRPVQKIAEIFVTDATPENQALNGTEIDGWKTRVLELYELKRGNVTG